MNLHQGHHVFDVESEIVELGNVPPPVSLRPWQRRIDRAAGKTVTNQSRVRIVWGQDYNLASTPILGERRLKYPFYRVEGDDGKIHDIGIPRYYIEELHEAGELKKTDFGSEVNRWDRARYHIDENTKEKLDVLGPCPDEFYSCLFMVAHHDERCCAGLGHVKYEPCLGSYREPNESDVERIRKAIWNRDHAPRQENAPSDDLLAKRKADYVENRDERRRATFRQNMADWVRTHAIGWDTLDPSVKSWGKYAFTAAHSRSGLKKETNGANSSQNGAGSGS